MSAPADLRARAEGIAAPFPPLLAVAERLAATVQMGDHGRRRAGAGDTFWQYRPATSVDDPRRIDWRRSGRGDAHFVQEREWQVAQSVHLWADQAASMHYASGDVTKATRAAELALALAILLLRGGERVGLTHAVPPQRGEAQLLRLATAIEGDAGDDYGTPDLRGLTRQSVAVLFSDFLGDMAGVETALTHAAAQGVRGVLVQVLDPAEETFPFDGRTVFQSMTGAVQHETLRAGALRDRYQARLADRQAVLSRLAGATGWQVQIHRTDAPAVQGLLPLWQAVGGHVG